MKLELPKIGETWVWPKYFSIKIHNICSDVYNGSFPFASCGVSIREYGLKKLK